MQVSTHPAKNIIVINPNSSADITARIDLILQPFRFPGGPSIQCVTLEEGPPAIEAQQDVDGVIIPLCNYVQKRGDGDAFVIACYSDPGLFSVREATRRPVFGIAESAILMAMAQGERFGVISILEQSIPRHLRHIRMIGVMDRLAGDLAMGLHVRELADETMTLRRLVEVGRVLRDSHGADTLVMGCAGLGNYRGALEDAVNLPVIEPVQAGVTMAFGSLLSGHTPWSRDREMARILA